MECALFFVFSLGQHARDEVSPVIRGQNRVFSLCSLWLNNSSASICVHLRLTASFPSLTSVKYFLRASVPLWSRSAGSPVFISVFSFFPKIRAIRVIRVPLCGILAF